VHAARIRLRYRAASNRLGDLPLRAGPAADFQGRLDQAGEAGANRHSSNIEPSGAIRIKNYTLKGLVMYAYDIFDFQISGGAARVATDASSRRA